MGHSHDWGRTFCRCCIPRVIKKKKKQKTFHLHLFCLSICYSSYHKYLLPNLMFLFLNRKEALQHKTFHRYTVRAKRGTAQGLRDSQNHSHTPKSAGAALRRYNEAALVKARLFSIQQLFKFTVSTNLNPKSKFDVAIVHLHKWNLCKQNPTVLFFFKKKNTICLLCCWIKSTTKS